MAALVLGRNALGSFKEDRVIDCCLQQIPLKLLLNWWRNGYLIFFKGLIWLSGEVLGLIECTHSYLIANHLGVRNHVLPNTHPDLVPTRLFCWLVDLTGAWALSLQPLWVTLESAKLPIRCSLLASTETQWEQLPSIIFIVEWMDFQCYERPLPHCKASPWSGRWKIHGPHINALWRSDLSLPH